MQELEDINGLGSIDEERFTDVGNAKLLMKYYAIQFRYVSDWGWLAWDKTRWIHDKDESIVGAAINTITKTCEDWRNSSAHTDELVISKWARSSLSRNKLLAMIDIAKGLPQFRAQPEDFDHDPWLLNLQNGVLNLRTGMLSEHDPQNLITLLANTKYDREAGCPNWLAFLDNIMAGDPEMVSFLQRAVGYTLTGDTSEQCLFFLYGRGCNGKSTFINTIFNLMGEFSAKIQAETLIVKRWNGNSNDLARLTKKHLVVASELDRAQMLNESLIKDMTGGDLIAARLLYKEYFEFKPAFKLWMYGNHKPKVQGTDRGIWRRILLIPFAVDIPVADIDQHLGEKLIMELPGILNWAIQGCLDWQKIGLVVPDRVKNATQSYNREMDPVKAFIEDRCKRDPNTYVGKSLFYNSYRSWCAEMGEQPLTKNALGKDMANRGFEIDVRSSQERIWSGICLKLNPADVSEPISLPVTQPLHHLYK